MVMKIALFSMSLARKYVHRFKIIKIFIQVKKYRYMYVLMLMGFFFKLMTLTIEKIFG